MKEEGNFGMKRILFILISLSLVVACSNGENNEVEQNVDGNNVEEVAGSDVSVKFAGIDVFIKRHNIEISGEVQTTEDHFYYKLDHDEKSIIEETKVDVDQTDGEWYSFELEIDIEDEGLTNEDVPFLTFYGKDGDKIINPNYVPVDLVYY